MGISRSENMRRIRSKDTAPEMIVRRLVHRMGYRFRLHRKDIAGKPDLAFPARRKVIFIHGCFWHQHPGCREGRPPKSNVDYWIPKLERNRQRDNVAHEQLAASGWDALVIWECETRESRTLMMTLRRFLGVRRQKSSRRSRSSR